MQDSMGEEGGKGIESKILGYEYPQQVFGVRFLEGEKCARAMTLFIFHGLGWSAPLNHLPDVKIAGSDIALHFDLILVDRMVSSHVLYMLPVVFKN
jgi:hypothetical protein